MNPFDLNSMFDSFTYENISALNCNNEKQIIKAFRNLMASDKGSITPDNVMVYSAMKKHLLSENTTIRNLATDLLLKFYIEGQTSIVINELTALWLYKFIENPSHKSSNTLYQSFLNFKAVKESFLKLLNFKEAPLASLNGLLFALRRSDKECDNKNAQEENRKKYKEYFTAKALLFKYNSNVILLKVYDILRYLGTIEEIYNEVVLVTAPSLINNKWKIIFDIYKKVPDCIRRDSKYIQPDLLTRIIESCDDLEEFEVKTNENLYIILSKIQRKEDYILKYFLKVNYRELDFTRIGVSLEFLDKNYELFIVNEVIKHTLSVHKISIHDFDKHNIYAIQEDPFLSSIIDIERLTEGSNLNDAIDRLKLSEENHLKNSKILNQIFTSLKGLSQDKIIERSACLNIPLKEGNFEHRTIQNNIKDSLMVFKKETFFREGAKFTNVEVILKYPEEFDDSDIEIAIKKDFIPFIGIKRAFKSVSQVLNHMSLTELHEITTKYVFPEEYDLFFYFKFRKGELRKINYNQLVTVFLNGSFISELFDNPAFDRSKFFEEVRLFISNYAVPITTEYSASFYDKIPAFFECVTQRKRLLDLIELKKVYFNNTQTNEERLMLLVINEILNESDFECIVENCTLSLGRNQVFLDKVLHDNKSTRSLDTESWEFKRNLKKDEKRTIDVCLRNAAFELQTLKAVDFSYISNEGLKVVVEKIVEYLKTDASSTESFHSFESETDDLDFFCLEKYVTMDLTIKSPTINDIVGFLETDKLFLGDFFEERAVIYKPLLSLLCNDLANNMINNYSLSKVEKDIDDFELFAFIVSGFPSNPVLFWILLLEATLKIRNADLVMFLEENLIKHEPLRKHFDALYAKYKRHIAFLFPNLYVSLSKTKVDLESLVHEEACNKIENVNVKMNKTSTNYSLKITYLNQNDEFVCFIKIPFDFPFKRPVFSTNVEKNSLLNIKVAELIRKTSKFMSIINLWKINIDKKVEGAKECLFCYFILHTTDGTFPEYACIHCNNKFHSRCIERWTKTYNKRTCPLCRQPIPLY